MGSRYADDDFDPDESLDEVEVEEAPQRPAEVIPVTPEARPVPKGVGGSFVKRGGQRFPRGS